VKVRIGYGLGTRTRLHGPELGVVVDELERLRFDSLWLSERISGDAPDPVVAMAYGAGRTERLKFGMSVMVLPGRNPVVLAKELATMATMSGGRLLPAFGLGAVDPLEQQAFGVRREERAALFDEMLAVMRACWTGTEFSHHGERFHYDRIQVRPAPARMDVWLGGFAPSELRRVGRLADGWLPSFVLPADAEAGRVVIERVAAEHERRIDDDHYGVLIPYAFGPIPDALTAVLAKRRPDLDDVAELVPTSWEALAGMIRRFVDVGTTKFVVLPLDEPGDAESWADHLGQAADALLPLETG
jgi:probable F420-dependent oxidoreductase